MVNLIRRSMKILVALFLTMAATFLCTPVSAKSANEAVTTETGAAQTPPSPLKTERSLASTTWTCEIDKRVLELAFKADGTCVLTVSNTEGVVVHSESGRYTYAGGKLTFIRLDGTEVSTATVTWLGDNVIVFNLIGVDRIWTRI